MSEHSQKVAKSRFRAVVRNTLLNIGAVLGVICIAVVFASTFGGITPLVFRSGSMAPEIQAGALAFAKETPVSDVSVGDVVSVRNSAGTLVTHRVVSVALSGNQGELKLRGDANSAPDAEVYTVTSVDRVFFDVPYVGYALAWTRNPAIIFLLGVSVPALLYIAFAPRSGPRGGRRRKVVRAGSALALLGLVGIAVPGVPGTSGAFTDTGTMNTNPLTAHTVASPSSASCSEGLLSATISWPADTRYDYEVLLRRVSNNQVVSGPTQITGTASSRTFSSLSAGLGLGTFDFQVEIKAYLANTPTWVAPSAHIYKYIRVVAILVGATASCTDTSGT